MLSKIHSYTLLFRPFCPLGMARMLRKSEKFLRWKFQYTKSTEKLNIQLIHNQCTTSVYIFCSINNHLFPKHINAYDKDLKPPVQRFPKLSKSVRVATTCRANSDYLRMQARSGAPVVCVPWQRIGKSLRKTTLQDQYRCTKIKSLFHSKQKVNKWMFYRLCTWVHALSTYSNEFSCVRTKKLEMFFDFT